MNNQNIQQLNKRRIYKQLHYLFTFYCGKSSKHTYKSLALKYWMKLIEDLYMIEDRVIIANSQEWNIYCNIFHGVGKRSNINFQQFLKILYEISFHFNKSYDPKDGFSLLINQLIKIYINSVKPIIQNKYIQFKASISDLTLQYLQKYVETLYLLYQAYFGIEAVILNQKSHIIQFQINRIFQKLLLFYRQFQIYPKILSASELYFIFYQIVFKGIYNTNLFKDSRISSIHKNPKESHHSDPKESLHSDPKESLYNNPKESSKLPSNKKPQFNFNKFCYMLNRVSILGIMNPIEYKDKQLDEKKQKMAIKSMLDYMQNIKNNNKNQKCKFHYLKITFHQQQIIQKHEEQKKQYNGNNKKNKNFYDLFNSINI